MGVNPSPAHRAGHDWARHADAAQEILVDESDEELAQGERNFSAGPGLDKFLLQPADLEERGVR